MRRCLSPNPMQPAFRIVASLLLGILLFAGVAPAAAAARKASPRAFWLAFVTDSHLGSPQGNKWADVIPQDIRAHGLALGSQAAFIIHGGDMTEFGTRDQYARYQETFATIGRPVYGVPGNHESKWGDAGKSGFRYALGKTYTSFDHQGVHFVLLDTSVDGEQHGHLERYMLDWLKQDLKKSGGRPAVVFCHHPIGYSVSRFIDNDDEFFEAVRPFNVRAVFTGHGHMPLKWVVNGISCFMAPAAMDGQYMTLRVEGDSMEIFTKAAGADPVPLATVALEPGAASGPSIDVRAEISGEEMRIRAEYAGVAFTPATAKYRINLGPWKDLEIAAGAREAGGATVYSATEDALSLAEGVHSVHVRFETSGQDAWTRRCEVVIDRTPAGGRGKRILWKYSGPGGVQGTPTTASDLLLFGANDGTVTALRRSDGRQAWTFKADGGVPGRITVSGQYAYFGTAAGSVYCLDLRRGARKWKCDLDASVVGGVAVAGDRVIAGTTLGSVYSLDAAKGKQVWKQRVEGAIRSSPSVGAGRVILGAWDGKVYSLSTSTGEIQWSAVIDGSPYYSAANSKPLVTNGAVYVTSPANPRSGGYGVTAIDEATGSVLWRAAVNAGYSEPLFSREEIVVTDSAGTVYFLDPRTGAVNGLIKGGGPCLDSSAVPGPAGSFITGTTTGQVRILSPASRRPPAGASSDSSPDHSKDAGGEEAEAPAGPAVLQVGDGFIFAGVAVSGQTAYVCTMGGDVYALNIEGVTALDR